MTIFVQDFRYPINVILTGEIDFSQPETQKRIETMMTAFENSTYIKPSLSTSWLRDFLGYVESSRGYGDTDLSIVTEQDFVTTLRDVYLADQVR